MRDAPRLSSLRKFLPKRAFVMKAPPKVQAETVFSETLLEPRNWVFLAQPNVGASELSSEEVQLFQRMVDALGLKSEDYALVSLGNGLSPEIMEQCSEARQVVTLGNEPLVPKNFPTTLVTHSLSVLLQNPQAKKETWKDLQAAKRAIGVGL